MASFSFDIATFRYVYPCMNAQQKAVVDLLLVIAPPNPQCTPRLLIKTLWDAQGPGFGNTSEFQYWRVGLGMTPSVCEDADGVIYGTFLFDSIAWAALAADYASDPWTRCKCPALTWPGPPYRDPCRTPPP